MKQSTTRTNATWVMAAIFLLIGMFKTHAQTTEVVKKNLALVQNLKPTNVWKNFANLSSIPRCSGNESMVADYIISLANAEGYKSIKDSLSNVVVYIPATKGFENVPSICIQAHLDMVCQKGSGNGDDIFPLKLVKVKDTIKALGTTLGADDGVGTGASATIIAEAKKFKHGALELFFTSQEEAGLIGAKGFDYSLLKSKRILNVDSEEEGKLTIGCAGGALIECNIGVTFVKPDGAGTFYDFKISGLTGGHSGGEINMGRANAIVLMSQFFSIMSHLKLGLVSFTGGSKVNTIPREASVTLWVPEAYAKDFPEMVRNIGKVLGSDFPKENIEFTVKENSDAKMVMSEESHNSLINILLSLPNGVITTEPGNSNLVQTSNNIGIVSMSPDTISIRLLFRSSLNKSILSIKDEVQAICPGQNVKSLFQFPPWMPDYNSKFVKEAVDTYNKLFNKELAINVTHGGLEAAVFFEKIPNSEIISIGPTIKGAHTPDERVEIKSVERFYKFLLELITVK